MPETMEQRARQLAFDMGYGVEWEDDETLVLTGYGGRYRFSDDWQEVLNFLDPNGPEREAENRSETGAVDISSLFNTDCVRVKVHEYENGIYLESIEVFPPDNRKAGWGTLTMKKIMLYCDAKMKPLYLYASDELGGDLERLQMWYTRIGMKETIWGRFNGNKFDFMYKPPTFLGDLKERR